MSAKDKAIISAIVAGYKASDDGAIFMPCGTRQTEYIGSKKYKMFTVPSRLCDGRGVVVLSHRFLAAYFYGVESLGAECVRHLDGDQSNNSRSNIRPGTNSENRMDIPAEVRQAVGSVAREKLRSMTDEQVRRVLKIRSESGMPYSAIGVLFGVCGSTVRLICKRRTYRNLDIGGPT